MLYKDWTGNENKKRNNSIIRMVRNFVRDQLGNSALYIFDDISHFFLILSTLRIYDNKLCYILQLFFYLSL